MDEPLAGVDASTERAIMEILRQLKINGKTVLVVHHDLQTVKDYFDHVLFLNRTVVAHGKTDSIFTGGNIEKHLRNHTRIEGGNWVCQFYYRVTFSGYCLAPYFLVWQRG